MSTLGRLSWIAAVALGASLVATDAVAIIGRPLTPMSYAGVARRTTRRTAYAYAATTAPVYASYASPPVTTLPPGCTPTGPTTYTCGPSTYRPYYQGTEVVYVAQ